MTPFGARQHCAYCPGGSHERGKCIRAAEQRRAVDARRPSFSARYGPDWPRKRAAAMQRAGGRCERCGAAGKDVHHVSSKTEVLCRRCHNRVTFARGVGR